MDLFFLFFRYRTFDDIRKNHRPLATSATEKKSYKIDIDFSLYLQSNVKKINSRGERVLDKVL